MKKLLMVLAQALVCTSILALPIRGMAEDQAPPQGGREVAAEMDPQFEEQLASEMENLPNFETSSDMKHALHELPDVEAE